MIGGKTEALLQVRTVTQNAIGEQVPEWETVQGLTGWLDLSGGDSRYTVYDAKIQESTHIFLADYKELDQEITAEDSRMLIGNTVYDVMLIDDPMEMHRQLEIYLKYTGGQEHGSDSD